MTTYGYARVSTNGQDLAAQVTELLAAGCAKVFKEKVSGAKTDRAELAKVVRTLQPGDVLVVTRLDRLARSTRDLLNVLAMVSEHESGFRSLKDTWADTTSPQGRLMLTILGGLAEFERELIRARTGEGRKRAKDRGVRFGRPAALTPQKRQEAIQKLVQGEAQADVARIFNVSQATISRLAVASGVAQLARRDATIKFRHEEIAVKEIAVKREVSCNRFHNEVLRLDISAQ
jgi:DNA invertase Pin-like site-specific DNA recombinase